MKNIQEVLDKISAMGSYLEKYMMINWTRILLITKHLPQMKTIIRLTLIMYLIRVLILIKRNTINYIYY